MKNTMDWAEFEANGGTWDEFVSEGMREFLGDYYDEWNQEGIIAE